MAFYLHGDKKNPVEIVNIGDYGLVIKDKKGNMRIVSPTDVSAGEEELFENPVARSLARFLKGRSGK